MARQRRCVCLYVCVRVCVCVCVCVRACVCMCPKKTCDGFLFLFVSSCTFLLCTPLTMIYYYADPTMADRVVTAGRREGKEGCRVHSASPSGSHECCSASSR